MEHPIVKRVEPESIAHEAGVQEGDVILSINGEFICDIFDYNFYTSDTSLVLNLKKPDGQEWEIEIEKDEDEGLGIEFEHPLIDKERSCANNCVFCFIDQLPVGMRETLYYKDDDSRLSFLHGNYITMTNMSEYEIDRIIRFRMSPINISVHTTNPELRRKMLGNKNAGNILERINKLVSSGITVNTQIVLCPGWNDLEELDKTLFDLTKMSPLLHSVSVVPVGITKHRNGLQQLRAFRTAEALKVVSQIEYWQSKLLACVGSRTVYASDEFYLLSGREIPNIASYEDFPQIENGVGMLASFRDEFVEGLRNYVEYDLKLSGSISLGDLNQRSASRADCLDVKKARKKSEADKGLTDINVRTTVKARRLTVVTGRAAADEIRRLVRLLKEELPITSELEIIEIENNFFGEHVTVCGLLTSQDIFNQLSAKTLGEAVLLPSNMFRSGTEMFLDDVSKNELQARLGLPLLIIGNDGLSFLEAIIDLDKKTM